MVTVSVTRPVPARARIRSRAWSSVTNTLPELSTPTPTGPVNRAVLFVPSAVPEVPANPAIVVVMPDSGERYVSEAFFAP